MPKYQRLRELLTKEPFPHSFTFKFVGKNSPEFEKGVREFELKHPELVQRSRRHSGNKNHVSLTYTLDADSPDVIVETYRSIAKIQDLVMVL